MDTRPAGFLFGDTIPGAKILPYDAIGAKALTLPEDKGGPIVVFGLNRVDPSPYAAAQRLIDLGYTNVRIFDAGLAAWRARP